MSSVPPPHNGLGSNSNYYMASDGAALTGVSVTIKTTKAIVSNIGMTIQVNAYPPSASQQNPDDLWWQQFVFAIGKDEEQARQLLGTCWIFVTDSGGKHHSSSGQTAKLPDLPPPPPNAGPTLPADCELQVEFTTDPQSHAVTAATYTVVDGEGKRSSTSLTVPESTRSPIMAFQVDIVGHAGGETSVFSSGAGKITYAATTPLTAASALPDYAQGPGTAEKANSVYGSLPVSPPAASIVQTFGITPPE